MSYILDALIKADRERNLGKVPDVHHLSSQLPRPQRSRWPWLMPVIGILNGLTLMIIVALVWQSEPDPPLAPLAVQQAEPSPVIVTEPTHQTALAEPEITVPVESVAAPKSTPPDSASAEPEQNAMQSGPQFESDNAELPPAALPLQALDVEFRQSLPTLNLDIHVYSDAPTQRFVMINGSYLREGDRLDSGPEVEAIVADGTVLYYRGQRFLLPVHR